jgi:predicted protein tyrosine phosphatase
MLVRVSSLARAEELANDWATRVISLVDAGTELPKFNVPHLVLHMADTEVATDLWAPQQGDIDQAFTFAGKCGSVLVHCEGGISRSPAFGIGLLVSAGLSPSDALIQLHTVRPNIHPNNLILSLCDTHLHMGGALLKEVQQVMSTLPQDLQLWCNDCQTYFKDGNNCPGNHWQ